METFKSLVGKTIIGYCLDENKTKLTFYTDCNRVYELYHSQDCCESVYIEDIVGDLQDLLFTPIIVAEESTSDKPSGSGEYSPLDECVLWTFYKLATQAGWVDIRWYGSSNGYYSVAVDIVCRNAEPHEIDTIITARIFKEKQLLQNLPHPSNIETLVKKI